MPSVEPLPAGSVLLQHNWVESFQQHNQIEADEAPAVEEYPCRDPINPHMRAISNRIYSFHSQSWNQDFMQATPEELAKAGLFFTGRSDRVKCWYCNGGLQNWDYTDSPIEEHAKWYPQCEFILREKGADFVQTMFDQNPNLKRPRIRNGSLKFRPQPRPVVADDVTVSMAVIEGPAAHAESSSTSSNHVESNDVVMTPVESSVDDVTQLVESSMKKCHAVVESVIAMGFDEELIRNTLTKTLSDDRTFQIESRFQLVDAVLNFEST